MARRATTEVEANKSLVPSPVKNRLLINPVPPIATNKMIAKLPSRLFGFNLLSKFIIRHSSFR